MSNEAQQPLTGTPLEAVVCSGVLGRVFLDDAGSYKPGDLPPEGYLQWHEWAEVQRKAGIKQVECGSCGKWQTPQELSGEKLTMPAKTSKGETVQLKLAVCTKCAAKRNLQNADVEARRELPPNPSDG